MLELIDVKISYENLICENKTLLKGVFKITNKSKFLSFDENFRFCNEKISDNIYLYIWFDIYRNSIKLINFLIIDNDNGVVHNLNISSYFKLISYYMKLNINRLIVGDYKRIKKIIFRNNEYKFSYILR